MELKVSAPAGLVLVKEAKPKRIKKVVKKKKVKSASQRGRASRRKGHSFEREVAQLFRSIGYAQACRNLEYQQGMGIDIANTGMYDIQCKRGKKPTSLAAIDEVPRKEGRVPLLIARQDGCEALVAMPLKHFLELINKADTNKEVTNVVTEAPNNHH